MAPLDMYPQFTTYPVISAYPLNAGGVHMANNDTSGSKFVAFAFTMVGGDGSVGVLITTVDASDWHLFASVAIKL